MAMAGGFTVPEDSASDAEPAGALPEDEDECHVDPGAQFPGRRPAVLPEPEAHPAGQTGAEL